jgi:hypothetical protein
LARDSSQTENNHQKVLARSRAVMKRTEGGGSKGARLERSSSRSSGDGGGSGTKPESDPQMTTHQRREAWTQRGIEQDRQTAVRRRDRQTLEAQSRYDE